MAELNSMQQKAVAANEGQYLVLAGAGSGKTTVLTERIARLLREHKARPDEILAITFTNKAAREMQARVRLSAAGFDLSHMWVCTFHSMCVRMLRMYRDPLMPFDGTFSIYDTDDSKKLLGQILKDLELDKEYDKHVLSKLRTAVSAYKNSTQALDNMRAQNDAEKGFRSLSEAEEEEDTRFGVFAHRKLWEMPAQVLDGVYGEYQGRLQKENAMDFDDLLLNANALLEHNSPARETLQQRFRYILVDEYQDTNPIQYELVRTLAGKHGNLFCVGDDDQAIYGFRGSDIRIIRGFREDYPASKTVRLEENYRSTAAILDAANAVISNNKGRLGKTLWTKHDAGTLPSVVYTDDDRDEARMIAGEIAERHRSGVPYSDNAVLYRAHAMSRLIETELMRHKIPYRMYGGTAFYERREIKDMLAWLTVLANPRADQQLLRIINVPARGIGAKTVDTCVQTAYAYGIPVTEVLQNADKYLSGRSVLAKARGFMKLYGRLRAEIGQVPVGQLLSDVYTETGYDEALRKEDPEGGRNDNVGELISAARQYETDSGAPYDLAGFLQNVSLMTDQDAPGKEQDAVNLMTIHASKGLEFGCVCIAGMVENMMPSGRAVQEGNLEEERRLCYVAITRAKRELTMYTNRQRMSYGKIVSCDPSRFLEELPEAAIELEDLLHVPQTAWG